MIKVENFEASHRAIRPWPTAREVQRQDAEKTAADLYWLAFLLTGRREISVDIAADGAASPPSTNAFFAGWMRDWSRRIVIEKALAASRDELAQSATKTRQERTPLSTGPAGRPLSAEMGKAHIEEALLAIDAFPRAAVILLIFESVPLADAATLLDADASLIRKAQAIGLREFTTKLDQNNGHHSP
jgi:hypothetical protein